MNSYIRPLSHYLNKNNKNVFTEFNNNNNVLLQQSPKLSSRKFRVFKTEENKNKSNKYIKKPTVQNSVKQKKETFGLTRNSLRLTNSTNSGSTLQTKTLKDTSKYTH